MSPSTDLRRRAPAPAPTAPSLMSSSNPSDFATSAQLSLRTRSASRFDNSPSSAPGRRDTACRTRLVQARDRRGIPGADSCRRGCAADFSADTCVKAVVSKVGSANSWPIARLYRGHGGLLRWSLVRFFFGATSPAGVRLRACSPDDDGGLDVGRFVVHRTMVNMRFQRTAVGQRQNIQACSPSAMEKKIICARPTMFSNGT